MMVNPQHQFPPGRVSQPKPPHKPQLPWQQRLPFRTPVLHQLIGARGGAVGGNSDSYASTMHAVCAWSEQKTPAVVIVPTQHSAPPPGKRLHPTPPQWPPQGPQQTCGSDALSVPELHHDGDGGGLLISLLGRGTSRERTRPGERAGQTLQMERGVRACRVNTMDSTL